MSESQTPLSPAQTVTTHLLDASVTLHPLSGPLNFTPLDAAGTLLGANIFSTHTFPVVLDGEEDVKKHQEWVDSKPQGIGIRDGTIAVMNKFMPGAVCPVHRTETIDFGVVVEGELELIMPDGSVGKKLGRGDVMVQRGTLHGWRNPSLENETLVFWVCPAAKPTQIGDQLLGADFSRF